MRITGGKYNGRVIKAPDEKIVRPTLSKVRMSVFNTLYSIIGDFEGKSFLDMFGGSGIMGLEALSRGFSEVVVFEKDNKVAQIIKSNYMALDLKPNINVGDSLKLVQKMDKKFDVIYIDPPYMSGIYEMAIQNIPDSDVVVLEHTEDVNFFDYRLIKQKKYGDKYLTFLSKNL